MLYEHLRKYFDNMFKDINPNIKLDEEQINAIMSENACSLVIAGAGTGKTTTMAAKVKYLVDIKHVDPEKIYVMSYTKKATQELETLILDQFKINAHVTTFHSLGYEFLRKIFPKKLCSVVDENEKNEIFYKYFCEIYQDKHKIKDIIEIFSDIFPKNNLFSKDFICNYDTYKTYYEYFNAYKKTKLEEAKKIGLSKMIKTWCEKNYNSETIRTINGEIVKSAAEAKIANYLFMHGIDYKYEEIYDEIMESRKPYKPDFTLDLGGNPVILEYFGLDDLKYNRIKEMKKDYHKVKHNKFIFLENTPIHEIATVLNMKLKAAGFVYHDRSLEEIYYKILDNNRLSNIFNFKDFLYECVKYIKEYDNRDEINDIIMKYINKVSKSEQEKVKKQTIIILEFYQYYLSSCFHHDIYHFDYADLIYYANKYLDKLTLDNTVNYIIIDEYQDISKMKYDLINKVINNSKSKLFAVGDDWQSIYSFSGSKIEYIYNFTNYFKDAHLYKISTTYRNCQELIDSAGEFVEKNDSQIKKDLVSNKHIKKPIIFKPFSIIDEDGEKNYNAESMAVKELIRSIHKENPNHNILILARKNKTITNLIDYNEDIIEDLGTKVKFLEYKDLDIDAMSIHKSKGLTYDEVIVMGLNKGFPSDMNDKFWLRGLLENGIANEGIDYPEERRLFYVALTRTKNHVYLLSETNPKYRSPFIDEIMKITSRGY